MRNMKKQVILIMDSPHYPFGQADQSLSKKPGLQIRTLVRKSHETKSLQQRNSLFDKITTLRSINNSHIIKIENVLEQQNSIHVLYEYVITGLVKNIKSYTTNNLQKIRDNLLDLSTMLAQHNLLVEWDIKNLGTNNKGEAKYYLDLNKIKIDKEKGGVNIQKLHFQNIMNIFAVYLGNRNTSAKNIQAKEPKQTHKLSVNQNNGNRLKARTMSSELEVNDKVQAKPHPSQQYSKQITPRKSVQQRQKQSEMRRSKTDWKKIQQNGNTQIMQDFLNVLDDQNEQQQAQTKNDRNKKLQQNDNQVVHIDYRKRDSQPYQNLANKHQDEQEQQVVWMSQAQKQKMSQTPSNSLSKNDEQEVVWVDYRDSMDIRERALAAMRRSVKALGVFKNIIHNYQQLYG